MLENLLQTRRIKYGGNIAHHHITDRGLNAEFARLGVHSGRWTAQMVFNTRPGAQEFLPVFHRVDHRKTLEMDLDHHSRGASQEPIRRGSATCHIITSDTLRPGFSSDSWSSRT